MSIIFDRLKKDVYSKQIHLCNLIMFGARNQLVNTRFENVSYSFHGLLSG